LLRRGATFVVVAEEELALEMVHQLLRGRGVGEAAISAALDLARGQRRADVPAADGSS
jgi:GNAT superfamily N-acetyltransferase